MESPLPCSTNTTFSFITYETKWFLYTLANIVGLHVLFIVAAGMWLTVNTGLGDYEGRLGLCMLLTHLIAYLTILLAPFNCVLLIAAAFEARALDRNKPSSNVARALRILVWGGICLAMVLGWWKTST